MGNGINPVLIRGTANASGGAVSGWAFVDQSGNLSVNASVTVPPVTANISGQAVFLGSGSVFGLSGLPVSFVSGAGAQLSGVTVLASITTNISGQAVFLGSGSTTGLSGVQMREVGTTIINSSLSGAYIITGNSGGSVLFSGGPLISATLRNASGNNPMFVAGLGSNATTTNIGIPLYANETLTFKVANFNAISAFASTSGQILFYVGLQ